MELLLNIENSEIKNKRYENKIEEYENQIKNYETNILESQQINKDLTNQKNIFEAKIKNLENENEEYRNHGIEMENMKEEINKKLEEKNKELEDSEIKYKEKEIEIEKIITEMNNLQKMLEKSICKTIHHGIACEKCFAEPIVGYRYKCSECDNYNLCQNCEEENSKNDEHPHDFIKIRKEQNNGNSNDKINNSVNNENNNYINININKKEQELKNKDNIDNFENKEELNKDNINNNEKKEDLDNNENKENLNNEENINNNENEKTNNNIDDINKKENELNNIIVNNNNEIDEDYSYKCLNKDKLVKEIYEGDKEIIFEIILQNINNNIWPDNKTKLSFDFDSQIIPNDIILEPQAHNEIKSYNITIDKLDAFSPGEYKVPFWFNVNDKNMGEKMELKIVIKEKENSDLKKIQQFRKNYDLCESDYSDAILLELLQENNFNEEEAISVLFNKSVL